MNDQTPLYNSRLVKNYVDYLHKYYPDLDIESLLKDAGLTRYELEDGGYYLSQEQVNRFQQILSQSTGNPKIAREVGRYAASSEAFGTIRQYFLGFLNPSMAYGLFEKIALKLTRGAVFKIVKKDRKRIEVLAIPANGVLEHPNQCENRLGTLEAIAKTYNQNYPVIEHPVCVNRGGDHCQYIIHWKTTPVYWWKIISRYVLLISFLLYLPLVFFLPTKILVEVVSVLAILNLGVFLYAKNLETREIIQNIKMESNSANLLVDQMNLRYNEAKLIQEIGQATSMILITEDLLKSVMEALEKRLDFKRGMIFMADKNKKRLIFFVGYGYSPEENAYLENLSFGLDNPQSKGVVVLTFREQKPFLIEDVAKIKQDISPKSLEFVHRMDSHSFISVPIIFKGKSMGILLVDNPKSGRNLDQSDLNLLMGIAPQIAISINNALSYQKIQESEERFRSLSENSPDIIYTLGSDGAFTYVNPAWQRILGHSLAEVVGRYFVDFVKPEEFQHYRMIFKQTRKNRTTVQDLTGTLLHRNGSERYFSISAAPNYDPDGQFEGIVGTFKDITDRKLAEDALQYRMEFEKLITSISTHFINLPVDRVFSEITQALEQIGTFAGVDHCYIFRYQGKGQRAEMLCCWPDDGGMGLGNQTRDRLFEGLSWFYDRISRQEVFRVQDVMELPSEALKEKNRFQKLGIHSIVCVPMVYGGRLIGFLGFDSAKQGKSWSEEILTLVKIIGEIFANALERQRVEEEKTKLEEQLRQSQKMEAIGRLAGGVAHDFNNMLTGIIGYADLLLLSLDRGHPLVGKVEEIKKAGKRAASLTQQLLAFSRKQLLQPKVLDLNAVVNELKKMLQRLIGEDIILETTLEPEPWPVKVDPNQMGQVLMNLVVNARDALPQGGKIIIRTANSRLDQTHGRLWGVQLQPGPYVLLAVADNGLGMDEKIMSHIFEPFFTTKELGKGTGLGLSTVYGIIKQSEGYIWVDSRPGQGTVFQIFLPRADGFSDALPDSSGSRTLLQGSETILVVEDNDLVRNLTREALQQFGYRVIEAANGELALKVLPEFRDPIHLLLTDVVMPGINGRELAEKVLALRPDIKVLFMSGYTDNAIVQYGILEPGLSFIEKPFSPDVLAGRIRQVLNHRSGSPAGSLPGGD